MDDYKIEPVGGFLKYVCYSEHDYKEYQKCHNSDEIYYNPSSIHFDRSDACSNDPRFYQACDMSSDSHGRVTNNRFLCEHFLCKEIKTRTSGTYSYHPLKYVHLKGNHKICDGIKDCINTLQDEDECSADKTILRTGREVISSNICDYECDIENCEDEAICNGLIYGLYCDENTDSQNQGDSNIKYIRPREICDGHEDCESGKDESACDLTKGRHCKRTFWPYVYRPIHNFTRCGLDIYCASKVALDQSNCTDPSRVGGKCKIDGYQSTISKQAICLTFAQIGTPKGALCDDNIDQSLCFNYTKTCSIHKHQMCDGVDDCSDKYDESPLNCFTVESTCERHIGNGTVLKIPLMWIGDGIEDCIDGRDEAAWPTCGSGATKRIARNNNICQNVFMCDPWEVPAFVELQNLCDGINSCGNENNICSISRNSQSTFTVVSSTNRDLTKQLSYCFKGLESLEIQKELCIPEQFIFPDDDFFGVDTKTTLLLPNSTLDCDNMFGEQYLYTSCTDKCLNSSCPLKTIPRYEMCSSQYPTRIGTIANNDYLVFFSQSYGEVYTNNFFVCDNLVKCIDYSQVCNLVDDCGDASDEINCSNHFKCANSTSHYIPKTAKCDDKFDCFDLSDECNDRCTKQILGNNFLKGFSWLIGSLAILANSVIMIKNLGSLKACRSTVALINKSLVILISFGDCLIGCYLFTISFYDGLIFKKEYCQNQIAWITSLECSVIGVISTVGSQISLFAMTGLSMIRINGIWNSMRIPGEVTVRKSIAVAVSLSSIAMASIAIAVTPLVSNFEDFFVNGVKFSEELKVFIGTSDKKKILAVLEAYYGRMKTSTLSWKMIHKMVGDMYSKEKGYEDHTSEKRKVDFYGSDGVCLFKFFVQTDDPQKIFVWSILAVNFVCFIFISVSYLLIGIVSQRSSKSLAQSPGNEQVAKRNKKMNQRIAMIITTDFVCWIPFILICVLHSFEIVDATPWYSLFSMVILPINSVINPILYDELLTLMMRKPYSWVKSKFSSFSTTFSWRKRSAEITQKTTTEHKINVEKKEDENDQPEILVRSATVDLEGGNPMKSDDSQEQDEIAPLGKGADNTVKDIAKEDAQSKFGSAYEGDENVTKSETIEVLIHRVELVAKKNDSTINRGIDQQSEDKEPTINLITSEKEMDEDESLNKSCVKTMYANSDSGVKFEDIRVDKTEHDDEPEQDKRNMNHHSEEQQVVDQSISIKESSDTLLDAQTEKQKRIELADHHQGENAEATINVESEKEPSGICRDKDTKAQN